MYLHVNFGCIWLLIICGNLDVAHLLRNLFTLLNIDIEKSNFPSTYHINFNFNVLLVLNYIYVSSCLHLSKVKEIYSFAQIKVEFGKNFNRLLFERISQNRQW